MVLNNQQAWRGSVGVSEYQGIISPAYFVLRQRNNFYVKAYLNYLVRNKCIVNQFAMSSKGVGSIQRQIYEPYLRNVVLLLPPIEEQQQIVRYLDAQTSQIDRAIRGYERLLELLEERKTAVINEAVTKGVRWGVAMKESGVDWLGEFPAHWKLSTVKQHFHIKKDIAGKDGYDVLSITQSGIRKKNVASNEGQLANDYSGYQFVNSGEFAMNHMDLLTGYIGLSPYFGVTSPDYRVFVLDDVEHCDAEYFLHVFQLGYKRRIFYKFGRGAASKGRWRLPARAFLSYAIPLPPIEEQRDIVQYIDAQQRQLDKAIVGIQREMDLLRERRTRLIADVVTGQIDVRDAVVPETGEVCDDDDGHDGAGA